MSVVTGVDLDAIYGGDNTATGDAIRLLLQRSRQGVQPILTDRIIVPTYENSGLLIETELGQGLTRIGYPYYTSTGTPFGSANEQLVDLWIKERLLLGSMIDVADTWASSEAFGNVSDGSDPDIGVDKVLYRAAPSADRDIRQIYKPVANATTGSPNGQFVVVWNDSDYVITFWDRLGSGGTGGAGQSFIINGPIEIGPQGAAILVYDEDYDWPGGSGFGGWRVVGTSLSAPVRSWTPVLSSTGTPPSGYSSIGDYRHSNGWVEGNGSVTLSGGWSVGTGVYTFSLPVTAITPANSVNVIGSALILDASTSEYWHGTVKLIGSSLATIVPDDSRAQVGPGVPITYASSDQIGFSFSYKAG